MHDQQNIKKKNLVFIFAIVGYAFLPCHFFGELSLKQSEFTAIPLSRYQYKLLHICRNDTEFVITAFSYIHYMEYKEFEVIGRNPSIGGRSFRVAIVLI